MLRWLSVSFLCIFIALLACAAPDAAVDRASHAVGSKPGCRVRTTLGGHVVWTFFNRRNDPCVPVSGAAHRDLNLQNELIRLINSVPSGETIRGNVFILTSDKIADALLRAEGRGVRVYISADKHQKSSNDGAWTTLRKLDRLRFCSDPGNTGAAGCIAKSDTGIAHTKLFTFSRARDPNGRLFRNVSWFGSYNQTFGTGGSDGFNNTVTVYGDRRLYDGLSLIARRMYRETRFLDFYDPSIPRGYVNARSANTYSSPETQTDLWVGRLRKWTPSDSCDVRVMHAFILNSRAAVVDELIELKKGGCRVRVVGNHMDAAQVAKMKSAGIRVRENTVHDKVMVIRGKFGTARQWRVYTGSHNLTKSANDFNDELLVMLAAESSRSHRTYSAFARHFEDAWDSGSAL